MSLAALSGCRVWTAVPSDKWATLAPDEPVRIKTSNQQFELSSAKVVSMPWAPGPRRFEQASPGMPPPAFSLGTWAAPSEPHLFIAGLPRTPVLLTNGITSQGWFVLVPVGVFPLDLRTYTRRPGATVGGIAAVVGLLTMAGIAGVAGAIFVTGLPYGNG